METVQPTLKWYQERSRIAAGPPRCPFASVQRCPRYYQGISLLGEAQVTTAIPADEDRRLLAAWRRSDLWPRIHEQSTSIVGRTEDPRHFMNFCPETLFDRFGLFVSDLHGYADEIDVDVAHSTLKACNVPPSDWQWTWAAAKPMHYTDCPLYSPLTESGANHFSDLELDIMCTQRNERDPFRVVIEMLEGQ